MFRDLFGVLALFSDSLGLFTSIALGFVPKDPNWSGNGPKQNFQKTWKTCLTSAQFELTSHVLHGIGISTNFGNTPGLLVEPAPLQPNEPCYY